MGIARFEVMRAATDQRNTVWAAALATAVRAGEDSRAAVTSEILRLLESGDLYLAHTYWSGESPSPIARQAAEDTLLDESQWHPRRLPWAKRLRLYATEQGATRFKAGEFGAPSHMARPVTSVAELLEVQGITCSEAIGMAVAVAGFLLGGGVGLVVGTAGIPADFSDWTGAGLLGWVLGGVVGLALTLHAWRLIFPEEAARALPETTVPDQFNEGPDLNSRDAFGDPRF
jgi:hypothetical protein